MCFIFFSIAFSFSLTPSPLQWCGSSPEEEYNIDVVPPHRCRWMEWVGPFPVEEKKIGEWWIIFSAYHHYHKSVITDDILQITRPSNLSLRPGGVIEALPALPAWPVMILRLCVFQHRKPDLFFFSFLICSLSVLLDHSSQDIGRISWPTWHIGNFPRRRYQIGPFPLFLLWEMASEIRYLTFRKSWSCTSGGQTKYNVSCFFLII